MSNILLILLKKPKPKKVLRGSYFVFKSKALFHNAFFIFFRPNKPISRILSPHYYNIYIVGGMIIYLAPQLLTGSSCLPNLALRQVEFATRSPLLGAELRSVMIMEYSLFIVIHRNTFHISPPPLLQQSSMNKSNLYKIKFYHNKCLIVKVVGDSIVSVVLVLTSYCYEVGGRYPLPLHFQFSPSQLLKINLRI